MTLGLTGNPDKDALWTPLARLVAQLRADGETFVLDPRLAEGLAARDLVGSAGPLDPYVADLPTAATRPVGDSGRPDVVLSFGGDGTMLRTAHALGRAETPILGVNIGRLGFLADIETGELDAVVARLRAGDYRVEPRAVLEAAVVDATVLPSPRGERGPTLPDTTLGKPADAATSAPGDAPIPPRISPWALNEFAIERAGRAGLLAIRVHVSGVFLNTYWGDGLIVATPTGSTAYSLSVGGPILAPEAGVVVLSPIAPHTLTVRPIVLSDDVTLDIAVRTRDAFVVAADGSTTLLGGSARLRIARAAHRVHLVKLPERPFFATLRSKLLWGRGAKDG